MSVGKLSHPFIYGRPVRPNEFFNREMSLRSVFNRLRNAESTAIVGEPHIGKSSLLLKLADETTQKAYLGCEAERLLVTQIDLHPINYDYTAALFWAEALEGLAGESGKESVVQYLSYAVERGYNRRSLERLFNYMGQHGYKLVLLLDEFERLLYHPHFKDPAFFALLRSLSTRTGGLVIIPASRLSVAQMNDRSRGLLETGSPFFNNIIEEKLGLFDDTTLNALLAQAGETFLPMDKLVISQVTGQHPFLVQAMAAALAEEEPAPQHHARAVARFYERVSFHFDDLWHMLDDRTRGIAVILSLLGLGGRTLGQDFAKDEIETIDDFGPALHRLANLGLARPLREIESSDWQSPVLWRGEQWTIAAQAFAWWVRQVLITRTRVVPSFDKWLAHEHYRSLLTSKQWEWLVDIVRTTTPAYRQSKIKAGELLGELRQVLIAHFDDGELRDLSFRLRIEYDDLPGATRKDKVRELVSYCERHGRIQELHELIFKLRPHLLEF